MHTAVQLTETARPSNAHFDGILMKQLQESVFRVWLDDFGTGWSSVEYLLPLPANGLKIDRVICVALGSRIRDVLMQSVIDLAHELNRQTTYGFEPPEVAARAARLGCDHGQGYLWSAPVPAVNVDALRHELGCQSRALHTSQPRRRPARERPQPRSVDLLRS